MQSFDTSAAIAAGEIAAHRQTAGHAIEIRDVQIAGIVTAAARSWPPATPATSPTSGSH